MVGRDLEPSISTLIVRRVLNPLSHHLPRRNLYESAHRSMTDPDDSTMAASEDAGTEFKQVEPKNKSKRLKTTLAARIPVQ